MPSSKHTSRGGREAAAFHVRAMALLAWIPLAVLFAGCGREAPPAATTPPSAAAVAAAPAPALQPDANPPASPEPAPAPAATASDLPDTALTPERLTAMSPAELAARREAVSRALLASMSQLHDLTNTPQSAMSTGGMAIPSNVVAAAQLRSDIRSQIRDRAILDRAIQARAGSGGKP